MPRFRKKKATGPVLELQEAVERGLVRFDVVGVGPGVTSKIRLRLTKLTDDPFTVVVKPGTKFAPVPRRPQADVPTGR